MLFTCYDQSWLAFVPCFTRELRGHHKHTHTHAHTHTHTHTHARTRTHTCTHTHTDTHMHTHTHTHTHVNTHTCIIPEFAVMFLKQVYWCVLLTYVLFVFVPLEGVSQRSKWVHNLLVCVLHRRLVKLWIPVLVKWCVYRSWWSFHKVSGVVPTLQLGATERSLEARLTDV